MDLAFSDHDFYGIAVDLGLFDSVVPTVLSAELLGWYDNHDDPAFHVFRNDAMWSMCQRYFQYAAPGAYLEFMREAASSLNASLPVFRHWTADNLTAIDYVLRQRQAADRTKATVA
jgi:hypothetical protein